MAHKFDDAFYLMKRLLNMTNDKIVGHIRLNGADFAMLKKYYPTTTFFDNGVYRVNGDQITVNDVRVTSL